MAYDQTKYQFWKSAEVPRKIGLALADDNAPLIATPGVAVDDATTEAEAVTQLNALLASLRDAGFIEES